MLLGSTAAFAQLNSSVSVEGEYEPLVIETERLSTFPLGYKFELPASTLNYEYTGLVTDFRPDLLTMGATGRQADWPWKKRRGYVDARLGSYLDSRLDAGYFILENPRNTLFANLKFSSMAYKDGGSVPEAATSRLFDGHMGLRFTASPSPAHHLHAEAQADYLAYHNGASETRLNVGAGYAYSLTESSTIGIDLDGAFLFQGRTYGDYGVISLTPAYRLTKERLTLHTGVDLAFAYNAIGNLPGSKFDTFHIAPEIDVQYRPLSGLGVFLSATGGVTPSTMGMYADEWCGYRMPWVFTPNPIYTPVDGRVGVNAGPFAGFAASASVRYTVSRNVPLDAWSDPAAECVNLHGYSLNLGLRYAFGNIVEAWFDGAYSPQDGKEGVFNGFDRPRWVLEAGAAVRPIKKLKIDVGYDYRGVRNTYAVFTTASGMQLLPYRLPDITDLNAKVTYSILDNFDVYVKGSNLLNHKVDLLSGLNTTGLIIQGGIYLEF